MNDLQQAFLNMLIKVQDHLEDNATAYSSHAQIAPAKVLLDAKIQSIIEAAGIATEDTTGVTEDKQAARTALEKTMFKVANALNSYAEDNNMNELAGKTKYVQSELQQMQDTLLHEKAMRLATFITPVNTPLLIAGYNITAAQVTDLTTQTTAYFTAMPEPKDAIEAKAVAGKKIDRLQTESRTLLEKLDGYVDSYRYDNIELWEEYQLARAIDDNPTGGGGSGNVLEGTINPMTSNVLIKDGIIYNGATPVSIENTGSVDVAIALANSGMIAGPWWNVNPGITHNTTMAGLAPSGNELRGQNNTALPGTYRITIG